MNLHQVKTIAKCITDTALGRSYHGEALRDAKKLPGMAANDIALLDRWMTGNQTGVDHVALQYLANRLELIVTDFDSRR